MVLFAARCPNPSNDFLPFASSSLICCLSLIGDSSYGLRRSADSYTEPFCFFPSQLFLGLTEPVLKTGRLVSADFVQRLWLRVATRKEQRLIVARWGGLLTAAGTRSACSNSDDRSTADPCSGKTIRPIQLSVGEFSYRNSSAHAGLLYGSHCVSQQVLRPKKSFQDQIWRVFYCPTGVIFCGKRILMTYWAAKTKQLNKGENGISLEQTNKQTKHVYLKYFDNVWDSYWSLYPGSL